jgi:hypothetical protein
VLFTELIGENLCYLQNLFKNVLLDSDKLYLEYMCMDLDSI